jgi:prolipoprotein diacylglyceryltransferase
MASSSPSGETVCPCAPRPESSSTPTRSSTRGLWNLALAGLILLYERRPPDAPPGRLFALYVGGDALGRLWLEALRIDPASHIAGVRVKIWVSIVTLAITAAWLLVTRHR